MGKPKRVEHLHDSEIDQKLDQDLTAVESESDFEVVLDIEKQGKLVFEMPDEFYDTDKKVAKIKIFNKKDELKIIDSKDLNGIRTKDIREIIEGNAEVKKVVIEQVSINDAKRLSLLFDQDDEVSTDFENSVLAELNVNNPITRLGERGPQYIQKIELSINKLFLNITSIEDNDVFGLLDIDSSKEQDLLPKVNRLKVVSEKENEEDDLFNLKIKDESSAITSNKSNKSSDNETATYKKQTLIRKTKKKKVNDYYYQAKNHRDLFKVGNSYYEDVKNGVKSFSFSSIDAKEEQQKTIFGISAFFNYHSDLNVTIVTDSIEDTYYLKHIKNLKKNVKSVLDGSVDFEYYSVDGIDIIELKAFRTIFGSLEEHSYSDFLDEFLHDSEIVLWDLPQIELLDKEREMFFPITMIVENASIIVKSENNKMDDVEKMLDYYGKYNINVKGLVYSNTLKNKKKVDKNG